MLEYLLEKSKKQYVAGDLIGYVYLGLGDKTKMIELLREQLDSHGGPRIYLAVDPWLDPLRDDPQFQDLLRQMRFPTA